MHSGERSQFGATGVVHLLDFLLVLLEGHFPFEFETGSQGVVLQAEVLRHQVKVLHHLGSRNGLLVGLPEPLPNHLVEGRVVPGLLRRLDRATPALQKLSGCLLNGAAEGRFLEEADEAGEVVPVVANQHGVGQTGQCLFDLVFDEDGGNVLPSFGDHQLFDPPGDEQEIVLVYPSHVPGMHVALLVDGLARLLSVIEVPHAHIPASHADLALLVGRTDLENLGLGPWDHVAHLQVPLGGDWVVLENRCSAVRG